MRAMIFLFALFSLTAVQAAPVLLGAADSGRTLNGQIELLEDVGGQLNITDLADPAVQARFQPADGRASVGQSRNPWWIKVSLQRGENAPALWWLEVGSVTLLDLRLYLPGEDGGWHTRPSGERVSFAEGRDHPYRRMLFALPALGEQPLTFYLRSFDPAGNSFPLKIWQLEDLDQFAALENLCLGVIYGIILALLLYNLFIFLTLRDAAYFWYVTTTAGALLMILGMSGHGFQYLWPDSPVPFWLDRISIPALWGFGACRFTQSLLQTRQHVRWAHRLLDVSCALYVVAVILDGFGWRGFGAWLFVVLSLTSIPGALWAALVRGRQGYFPALLYLCGYGVILASVGLLLLRATGVVQPSAWNAYVFPLAVAAESILFSFALAYRIQMLKQDKAVALEQADREKSARLAQIQASAAELQQAVKQRTAELAASNQRLSQREQELELAAFHDPLTELPNRRHLIERVDNAMANAIRRGESFALMLIDLDHFKPINDRHGHDAGDMMLRTIAARLRESVRGLDSVARLGGDEFAVLICGPDAESHAKMIADRLLNKLSQPVAYASYHLWVTVSIGVAFYPRHATHFASLYQAADSALYEVKRGGRSAAAVSGGEEWPAGPADAGA